MSTHNKKLDPISIRLDADTKAGLEALAKADERPVSNYAALVLKRHVEANPLRSKASKAKP
jgi:predicted transcriptional regulator